MKISRLLGLLFRSRVIRNQPSSDFVGHVRTCTQELPTQALRGCGPDHVAIFANQPDSGDRLVLSFLTVVALAFADGQTPVPVFRPGPHLPVAPGLPPSLLLVT